MRNTINNPHVDHLVVCSGCRESFWFSYRIFDVYVSKFCGNCLTSTTTKLCESQRNIEMNAMADVRRKNSKKKISFKPVNNESGSELP
jgi:hypothetical protein